MSQKVTLTSLLVASVLLAGCQPQAAENSSPNIGTIAAAQSATPVVDSTEDTLVDESQKANQLFEEIFMQGVMRSPITQSFLGIKDNQDKWDNLSTAFQDESIKLTKENLEKLNVIDVNRLDAQTKVSYTLMKQQLENAIADDKWRDYDYPLNQMFGIHSQIPSLLINQHGISNVTDAEAYIARLGKVDSLFGQVIDGLNRRAERGIIAPKFVYPYVISDSKNILKGAPFTKGEDSTLLADFRKKVDALEIDQAKKETLIKNAIEALNKSVKPGYDNLIKAVSLIADRADNKDGVWKFPEGQVFYNNRLARMTTTDLTAKEIHSIGLSEVKRIHNEMRSIMKTVGFKGSLQEFFEFMRKDKQFYYPETAEGKEKYLAEATNLINTMKSRLDELFIVKPKADLTVKAVEAFREKSAGKAFYQRPSMDGSRPGIYYANLYRMSDMPIYQMEALAYHEGIPGHHMQLAISQELQGIPKFRKFGRYTAYTEGWGLYSEYLPKEVGFYSDPYSDFGRLAMELWRACRLVVDTGIHAMKWDREKGIEFYSNNTPNPKPDAVKMVERHIIMPAQATAYKIGMNKIIELREHASKKMGDKFDIREFHDVVLQNGPVPLNILESFVGDYIENK